MDFRPTTECPHCGAALRARTARLAGFEAALGDKREKQRMWAYIKQIGPVGAPY